MLALCRPQQVHTRALNNLRLFFPGKETVIVAVVASLTGAGVTAITVYLIVIKIKRKTNNRGVHTVETEKGITTTIVVIKRDLREGGDFCKKGFDTKEIEEKDKSGSSVSAVIGGIPSAFV